MKPFDKTIYVTRPFLPTLEEFCQGLAEIWETRWLTNNGPILCRFTQALSKYFDTENICLFNNGTLALQIALQGMEITGEVITTPFTFVGTTHALVWNKIRPVFADIEPTYYTLDPEKVEQAITPRTTAILAVHIYGYPCHLEALADIARRHNLKLIYDAAHAFGVRIGNHSIAHFGDLTMFSFHATKPFHTLEGGLLIFQNPDLRGTFNYLKNFGFKNEIEVVMPGTNAKMNEMQALMGILVLKHFEKITRHRAKITMAYRSRLQAIKGIHLVPPLSPEITLSHAYMPIEIDENEFGISRDALYENLKLWNVYARRYFFPLVCDYDCYRNLRNGSTDPLTTARRVADRILTLPIYDGLKLDEVEQICDIIQGLHLGRVHSPPAVALR
jgi:dTDP-4-amino-4,6-dideoxygalactose transaminase